MSDFQAVRVVLVDDHPLFRRGLTQLLRADRAFDIVCEAGHAAEARACARTRQLDLAIVDVLMPGTSGITFTQELCELQPGCRVLGLSAVAEPGLIADMLRAGACGFALKSQPIPEIVEAVRLVAGGERYLPPTVDVAGIEAALSSRDTARLERLTKREREIFELMIRGHSNHAIAQQLFIALRTVETHRQRIVKKLSARTIVEMQRIAARYGGLDP
jgi:DNA-binding NarL/FixJ family response regulator